MLVMGNNKRALLEYGMWIYGGWEKGMLVIGNS